MQLVQSSRAQALSVERGVCDHGSYVFWERTISVFLKENRALGEDWGPVIGAEQAKERKPGFGGFRFFPWVGQSNHEKSLQ